MKKIYRALLVLLILAILTTVGYAVNRSPYGKLRPEHLAEQEAKRAELASGSIDPDVPVYDIGEYDLGNGVTLTVAETMAADEEMLDKSRLNLIFDPLPLPTDDWFWVCDDNPALKTNLIIYNRSSQDCGSVSVKVNVGDTSAEAQDLYYVGIKPGTHGTISFEPASYSVFLKGTVPYVHYNVRVTDMPWPL